MNTLALWMVAYLANALWMVPLVFVAAWVATAITRSLGPHVAHRIWVAALLTEVLIPALHLRALDAGSLMQTLWPAHAVGAAGRTAISVTPGAAHLAGMLVLPATAVSAVATVYAVMLAYLAGKFLWSLWKTHLIVSGSERVREELQAQWKGVTRAFGLDARILESEGIAGPATVALYQHVLLLPPGFDQGASEEDLAALMAHECAHMKRHDFAKNLLYTLIALPCAFHPLLWVTRSRIQESREMICDAMAADLLRGRRSYARSLLRLASAMVERPPANIHALGIFDANHLERRIMHLNRRTATTGTMMRGLLLAACAVIGLATWASAMTLRTDIGSKETSAKASKTQNRQGDLTMPVLIHSEIPEYPVAGKKDHVSGICLVSLTVDEQGIPTKVHIAKSLRPDFDENAMKAVRGYRFRPALRDGKPVAREMKVQVQFAYF